MHLLKAPYRDWKRRWHRDQLEYARAAGLCYRRGIEEEKEPVIGYALTRPKDGQLRQCWQMVAEEVAYMSP